MLILVLLIQVVSIQWLVKRKPQLVLNRCKMLRLTDDAQVRLAHSVHLGGRRWILFKVVESGVAGDGPVAAGDALLDESLSVMVPASPAARKRVLTRGTGI